MKILTISGSSQLDSSNARLLKLLPQLVQGHDFVHFEKLMDFPLFTPLADNQPPLQVFEFKRLLAEADMVVISTPEYAHNIPAVLKNAFEWVTSSGEFYEKKVVAITYTPNPPRGKQAMQSMLWTLQALNAKVLAELPLYQSELKILPNGQVEGNASLEAIKIVFDYL